MFRVPAGRDAELTNPHLVIFAHLTRRFLQPAYIIVRTSVVQTTLRPASQIPRRLSHDFPSLGLLLPGESVRHRALGAKPFSNPRHDARAELGSLLTDMGSLSWTLSSLVVLLLLSLLFFDAS